MTDDEQAVEVALRQVEGLLAEGKRCSAQGGAMDPVVFKDGELVAFDCVDHSLDEWAAAPHDPTEVSSTLLPTLTGVAPYEARNSRDDGRPWVGFTVYLRQSLPLQVVRYSGPVYGTDEHVALRRATEHECVLWREAHLAAMEDQWAG